MAIPIKAALRVSSILWQWKSRNKIETNAVRKLLHDIRQIAYAVDHKSFILSMDRVIDQFEYLYKTSGEKND